MKRKEYSAGAVKHSFWFLEFKKIVSLLNDGKTFDEIERLNLDENIFGAPTQARAAQILSTVRGRIKTLDSSFYPVFVSSELATQKLFALVAAMAYDTLFFDFVYEVIREKMIIGSNEFTEADLRIFFKDKQQQNEKVARWTDYTCHRLGSCYKTMLYEAGLTDKAKDIRKINRPLLETDMQQWLENHDMTIMVHALTGVK